MNSAAPGGFGDWEDQAVPLGLCCAWHVFPVLWKVKSDVGLAWGAPSEGFHPPPAWGRIVGRALNCAQQPRLAPWVSAQWALPINLALSIRSSLWVRNLASQGGFFSGWVLRSLVPSGKLSGPFVLGSLHV